MADKSLGGQGEPASWAFAITPGSDELAVYPRALYVGVAGDVEVTMLGDGVSATFVGVPAGTILPIRVSHVTAGTTADSILGLY